MVLSVTFRIGADEVCTNSTSSLSTSIAMLCISRLSVSTTRIPLFFRITIPSTPASAPALIRTRWPTVNKGCGSATFGRRPARKISTSNSGRGVGRDSVPNIEQHPALRAHSPGDAIRCAQKRIPETTEDLPGLASRLSTCAPFDKAAENARSASVPCDAPLSSHAGRWCRPQTSFSLTSMPDFGRFCAQLRHPHLEGIFQQSLPTSWSTCIR